MNIVEAERPVGVIVQFGGQTPLKLAQALGAAGVPIMGTSPDSIDLAEDRKRFGSMLKRLGVNQPAHGTATSYKEASRIARQVGYPVLVRPSYVLGGRAMEIVYSEDMLERYIAHAVKASPERPILIDKFLEGAIEVDVDALCDGTDVFIGAVMEHIEEAGVHSGDSACVIPPFTLSESILDHVRQTTRVLALELKVSGLINIQFAVKDDRVYVLEVNPRASRTVPFVSKAIGIPMAKMAAKVMAGKSLRELGLGDTPTAGHFSIKEAVLPFGRFPEVDTVLGPEMKSTGEVMGIDARFGEAFAKSQLAAGFDLPTSGKVFVSVANRDKRNAIMVGQSLVGMGFEIVATSGTAEVMRKAGVPASTVLKVHEGRPNVVDLIKNREVGLVVNIPFGRGSRSDGYEIRTAAAAHGVPCITTLAAAQAVLTGIQALMAGELTVKTLQDYQDGGVRHEQPDPSQEHDPPPPPSIGTGEQLSMLRETGGRDGAGTGRGAREIS
jgi:carbamoyl-phosphate synthase large subunit